MKKTNHAFIVFNSNIRGNNPIISGTGIRVIDIAIEYQYKGYTVDQIIDYHPHLKLEQVYDALSYYYENQEQIDSNIKNEQEYVDQIRKKTLINQSAIT